MGCRVTSGQRAQAGHDQDGEAAIAEQPGAPDVSRDEVAQIGGREGDHPPGLVQDRRNRRPAGRGFGGQHIGRDERDPDRRGRDEHAPAGAPCDRQGQHDETEEHAVGHREGRHDGGQIGAEQPAQRRGPVPLRVERPAEPDQPGDRESEDADELDLEPPGEVLPLPQREQQDHDDGRKADAAERAGGRRAQHADQHRGLGDLNRQDRREIERSAAAEEHVVRVQHHRGNRIRCSLLGHRNALSGAAPCTSAL